VAIRKYSDALTPEDLAMLIRVFNQLCDKRGIDREQADDLAAALVAQFQRGVTDEQKLLNGIYPL
jgi:hypothetical protein